MMPFDQNSKHLCVERPCPAGDSPRGFTLVELVFVMAAMVVLATLSFGLFSGVQKRAKIVQAKGELGVLATALESYKLQYGDYPRTGEALQAPAVISSVILTDNAQSKLFNALVGKLGPKLDALESRTGAKIIGKSFV
ncbi:MAG: type II secretion system protein GspG, partial [Opitutaceae bacterium]|nr:type II secretion system protein GspG [Opitutaceae bacterium]